MRFLNINPHAGVEAILRNGITAFFNWRAFLLVALAINGRSPANIRWVIELPPRDGWYPLIDPVDPATERLWRNLDNMLVHKMKRKWERGHPSGWNQEEGDPLIMMENRGFITIPMFSSMKLRWKPNLLRTASRYCQDNLSKAFSIFTLITKCEFQGEALFMEWKIYWTIMMFSEISLQSMKAPYTAKMRVEINGFGRFTKIFATNLYKVLHKLIGW